MCECKCVRDRQRSESTREIFDTEGANKKREREKKGRLKRNCKSVGAGACERMGVCERERKRESVRVHVGRNEEER